MICFELLEIYGFSKYIFLLMTKSSRLMLGHFRYISGLIDPVLVSQSTTWNSYIGATSDYRQYLIMRSGV